MANLAKSLIAAWALLVLGCAGSKSAPPDGFAGAWKGSAKQWRALSADGVMFSSRQVDNKPEADLAFWREALKTRMSQAGYRVLGDSSFAQGGAEGSLLRLAAPLGRKDYLYFVALSVRGKHIRVVEAAGEATRLRAHEDAVLKAIAQAK